MQHRAAAALAAGILFALAFPAIAPLQPAVAEPAAKDGEKEAFEAAKALGTVEAWDAFLSNYPSGFYADLARAYVKKLAAPGTAAGSPPQTSPSGAKIEAAYEEPCSMARKLKSYQSTDPVKIRFVNASGAVRVIQWIDFNGALKEYATLQPGEELVQETFLTHPWIASYAEGSCAQLFMPGQPESIARLVADGAQKSSAGGDHGPTPEQTCRDIGQDYNGSECVKRQKSGKKSAERSARASCIELGMIYLNGKCAPKSKTRRQNAEKNKNKACPKGTYRNPNGVCQPNETGG